MSDPQTNTPPNGAVVHSGRPPGIRQADVYVPDFNVQELTWGTAAEVQESIKRLYLYAEAVADESIDWYGRHKRKLAWKSRLLRLLAIILTAVGGLTPILSALGWAQNLNIGQLGYLFLGLAAACVGLDRFIGFSSGWIRYITTKMTLERALSDFRFEWAMIEITVNTGMRPGECVKLAWPQVDFDALEIYLGRTKSGEDRFVPMNSRVAEVLARRRAAASSKFVFPNPKGTRPRCDYYRTYRRAAESLVRYQVDKNSSPGEGAGAKVVPSEQIEEG
jgi:integrase